MYVLRTDEASRWRRVLERVAQHDVYHLPEYHRLAELCGEGTAHFFVYEQAEYLVGLPLLVRPVEIEPDGEQFNDATSVYGYPGPVSSHDRLPPAVMEGWAAFLKDRMAQLGVVSVFSRLHPLLDVQPFLATLGARRLVGHTVSLDLAAQAGAGRPAYRKNHVRDIAALEKLGVRCVEDPDASGLTDFMDIYTQTMDRVGAAERYFFDHSYFENLTRLLGDHVRLFHCVHGQRIICSAVITECRGIVQYHLGGTRTEDLEFAPMKLLFDGVRSWAAAAGCSRFHLGGGVGGEDDGVYRFKTGFSDDRHPFYVWEWVVDEGAYALLCRATPVIEGESPRHFPAYRS